jgi:hypothetical protein
MNQARLAGGQTRFRIGFARDHGDAAGEAIEVIVDVAMEVPGHCLADIESDLQDPQVRCLGDDFRLCDLVLCFPGSFFPIGHCIPLL